MLNLIQSDFYRIFHSKTIKILLTMTTIFAIILIFGTHLIAEGKLSEEFVSLIFMTSDMNIITLVGAVLAVHIISGEFESRNMQHLVTSGYSRFKIAISKAITYCTMLAIVISPYFIAATIAMLANINLQANAIIGGIMMVVQTADVVELSKAFTLLVVIALVYIGQLSTTIVFAFLFKKASLVIPMFYFISIASGQVALYQEQLGDAANILKLTPFAPDFISINTGTSNGTLIAASITSVLYIVAMTVLACLYFKKREIK